MFSYSTWSVVLASILLCSCGGNSGSITSSSSQASSDGNSSSSASSSSVAPDFEISSPHFNLDGLLPATFSCEGKTFGEGELPALNWTAGPAETQSYAIVFKDMTIIQSANNVANGYHWAIWNIPSSTLNLPQNLSASQFPVEVSGARQLSGLPNSYKYLGPCPNWNFCNSTDAKETHGYSFVLYALPTANINPGNSVQAIDNYLMQNAIETTELRSISDATPACGNSSSSSTLNGEQLFRSHCSTCHFANGIGNGSNRSGADFQELQSSFNFGTMTFMRDDISDTQLQAIADWL